MLEAVVIAILVGLPVTLGGNYIYDRYLRKNKK